MFTAVHFLVWMSFLGYNNLLQPFKQDMPYIQYCAIKGWFDLYYISSENANKIQTLFISLHLWCVFLRCYIL